MKTVKRLQHYNFPNYMKPKFFDRWRSYIHSRKLFKYWLKFVDKRSQLVKSDLHFAFDKWRSFHPDQHRRLTLLPKKDLSKKAFKNNKILDNLADGISDKENTIDHLNAQRETLLDNYIKAQRLALTLWSNRNKNSIH